MPRLENTDGVIVSVSDETAVLLGSGWSPVGGVTRSETPDSSWKVNELKAHAGENGIDLGDATKKEDILAVINAPSGAGDESDNK